QSMLYILFISIQSPLFLLLDCSYLSGRSEIFLPLHSSHHFLTSQHPLIFICLPIINHFFPFTYFFVLVFHNLIYTNIFIIFFYPFYFFFSFFIYFLFLLLLLNLYEHLYYILPFFSFSFCFFDPCIL